NFQKVLHSLAATQEAPGIPVSTGEEARGSCTHPEEPRFRLVAVDEGSLRCLPCKDFWADPGASQEEALSTGKARGTSKRSFTPLLQLKKLPAYPSPLERKHAGPAHI
ncbi:hypothetical protein CSW69_26385, partial [Shigella sonnei]